MKILADKFIGYHLEMLPDAQYDMRDYYFKTRKDVDDFLTLGMVSLNSDGN